MEEQLYWLLIGAGISIVSGALGSLITHVLTLRREKAKWEKEQKLSEQKRLLLDPEQLEEFWTKHRHMNLEAGEMFLTSSDQFAKATKELTEGIKGSAITHSAFSELGFMIFKEMKECKSNSLEEYLSMLASHLGDSFFHRLSWEMPSSYLWRDLTKAMNYLAETIERQQGKEPPTSDNAENRKLK